jgi:hypothetical protein
MNEETHGQAPVPKWIVVATLAIMAESGKAGKGLLATFRDEVRK